MSDGELRDLERRWRASGAVEDEARWHVARVRAGALEPDRLALAAWTGWPGAVLAAQDEAAVAGTTSWVRRLFGGARSDPAASLAGGLPGLARWLDAGLKEAPLEAARRAALAEVERVALLLEALAAESADAPRTTDLSEGRSRAEVWAAVTHRLRERAQQFVGQHAGVGAASAWSAAAHAVLRDTAHVAADALAAGQAVDPPARLEWLDGPPAQLELLAATWPAVIHAASAAGRAKRAQGWWSALGARPARRFTGPDAQAWAEEVRAAQRAALAPWALGLSDPLRDRARSALDALEVASPCQVAWEGMRPVDAAGRVRSCDQCQQKVHDLGGLTRAEAEALLAAGRTTEVCVRFYRRPDGKVQTRDCGPAIDALVDQGAPRHMIMGRMAGPE